MQGGSAVSNLPIEVSREDAYTLWAITTGQAKNMRQAVAAAWCADKDGALAREATRLEGLADRIWLAICEAQERELERTYGKAL